MWEEAQKGHGSSGGWLSGGSEASKAMVPTPLLRTHYVLYMH